MNELRSWVRAAALWLASGAMVLSGCDALKTDSSRWLAADLVVKKPKRAPINMIRTTASVADERQELIPNATPPREEDYTYSDEDYVIGPTDVVDVSILDLYAVGQETLVRREVSDSGFIDLPLLPSRVKADGLTQEQLKDAIKAAYSPDYLRDPIVSVSVVARRQSTFSIIGAVDRRGTYNIIRKDMRLLEALALAGDVLQPNTKYLYVIRMAKAQVRRDPNRELVEPRRPEPLGPLPEPIPPGAVPGPTPAPPATAPQPTMEELDRLMPGSGPTTRPSGLPAPAALPLLTETSSATAASAGTGPAAPPARAYKWVYVNGKWTRVEQDAATAPAPTTRAPDDTTPPPRPPLAQPVTPEKEADPFNWKRIEKTELARVIAINYRSLQSGDARMNIVIRDNDVIQVPRDEVGEFYVYGEVARPGVYNLTGRKVTVKMALAAAGNLNAVAWPENSILIRRVGFNQEQVIPLDVEAIFRGEASDLFLKPDDLIAVGSDIRQPFLAVLRNAFRFTYGFGFVYDRNFSDPAIGSRGLDSRRFSRW